MASAPLTQFEIATREGGLEVDAWLTTTPGLLVTVGVDRPGYVLTHTATGKALPGHWQTRKAATLRADALAPVCDWTAEAPAAGPCVACRTRGQTRSGPCAPCGGLGIVPAGKGADDAGA